MKSTTTQEMIEYLGQFVTASRREKIESVLEQRTRHLAIVLEDIYQPQNASAALRTAECLGVQDVYIIENRNRYRINPDVTLGASKWLTLERFNHRDAFNTPECLQVLRERGYRLVATSPQAGGLSLDQISLDEKVAFLFGNEMDGLTQFSLEAADAHLWLPMFGFTKSYNISVSVAITLAFSLDRLRRSHISWGLGAEEKQALTLAWYRKIIDRADRIEREYRRRQRNSDV